jgi:hypothetical protein
MRGLLVQEKPQPTDIHVILNEKKKKKKKVIPPKIRHLFDERPMRPVYGGVKGEMKPVTVGLTKPLTEQQMKEKDAKIAAQKRAAKLQKGKKITKGQKNVKGQKGKLAREKRRTKNKNQQ